MATPPVLEPILKTPRAVAAHLKRAIANQWKSPPAISLAEAVRLNSSSHPDWYNENICRKLCYYYKSPNWLCRERVTWSRLVAAFLWLIFVQVANFASFLSSTRSKHTPPCSAIKLWTTITSTYCYDQSCILLSLESNVMGYLCVVQAIQLWTPPSFDTVSESQL